MSLHRSYDDWRTENHDNRPLRFNSSALDQAWLTVTHHVIGRSGDLIPVSESEYLVTFNPIGDCDFQITSIEASGTDGQMHKLSPEEFARISAVAYDDEDIREAAAEMWT